MVETALGKRVAAAGHVTEVYGPVQALLDYLKSKDEESTFITLPFTGAAIPVAEAKDYKSGEEIARQAGHANRGAALLQYFRDVRFVLRVLRRRQQVELFVGIGALNAFSGVLAKRRGYVKRTVYYVIDYTPKRFANPLMNAIYHWIDRYCVRHVDYVWNLSERMAEVRRAQGLDEARNMIVPVGVKLDATREVERSKVDRFRLVVMSHLTVSKGVQLAVEAMPEIAQAEPRARLEIIGTGPYEGELKSLAAPLVEKGLVSFSGAKSHEELFDYLPSCGIALATYVQDKDSISYYADPTKPKEYLACGLPVVITRLPWTAELIHERQMGLAIDYQRHELVAACLRLLGDDEFFWGCRQRAREYAAGLDWQVIYDSALGRMAGNDNASPA